MDNRTYIINGKDIDESIEGFFMFVIFSFMIEGTKWQIGFDWECGKVYHLAFHGKKERTRKKNLRRLARRWKRYEKLAKSYERAKTAVESGKR